MAVTIQNIIPAKNAEATQTTQYTVPSGLRTIIDKFTATNYGATSATLSVNLVTAGDTAGNQNLIVKTVALNAGQTYTFPEIVGQVLTQASFISTLASAATTINIRASGREIS